MQAHTKESGRSKKTIAKIVAKNPAVEPRKVYRRALVDMKVDADTMVLSPRELVRSKFAHNLNEALRHRRWRQTDLAKRTNIGRDAINAYCRGRMLPSSEKLTAICKVLGMDRADIMPHETEPASVREKSPVSWTEDADGTVLLQINKRMSSAKAHRIMAVMATND